MTKLRWSPMIASTLAAAAILPALPASAAKKPQPTGPQIVMSDAFRTQMASAKTALRSGDTATAAGIASSLRPSSDFEAYAAAGLRFELASRRSDVQAQRLALTDMFKTNAVPVGEAPRLRFLAGYFSYAVGNYDDALAQLGYAKTLGYDETDALLLTADIHLRRGKPKDARPFVDAAMARERAAGRAIPVAWYDRAISLAYQAGDWDAVGGLYRERLALGASKGEWRSALANAMTAPGIDKQAMLDLYRLQAANGAMASERDYQGYAAFAEKSGYNAEAKAIIEAGRSAGKLTPTQAATSQLFKTVSPKASKEIAALPAMVAKAAKSNKGDAALDAGDAYFSLGQYPQAVEQYRLALAKGSVDVDHVNSRLGVALARSGDLAGGKAALGQVSGKWASVAGFWSVWVDQQSGKASAGIGSATPAG